jgi:quinol monooxygenase YgiN
MAHAPDEINLIATFRAQPDAIDQVRDLIVGYGESVRQEPGNVFFEIYTDNSDPAAFVIVERYRNDEAFSAHLGTELGKEFNAKLSALIEGTGSELQFLTRHLPLGAQA